MFLEELFLQLLLVSLLVSPQQALSYRLPLSKALAYSKDPITQDENKIKGQKWKDDKVKQVEGKTSPSQCHRSLTEELIAQPDHRGAGEGRRGSSNIQQLCFTAEEPR